MPVIFRSAPVNVPFTFESIGTEWEQPPVVRPKGYPYYHYLQTEKGCGRISTPVGTFTLHEDEGLLLAPFIRHSYEKETSVWTTKFASFTGALESSIPSIIGSHAAVRIDREQGRQLAVGPLELGLALLVGSPDGLLDGGDRLRIRLGDDEAEAVLGRRIVAVGVVGLEYVDVGPARVGSGNHLGLICLFVHFSLL